MNPNELAMQQNQAGFQPPQMPNVGINPTMDGAVGVGVGALGGLALKNIINKPGRFNGFGGAVLAGLVIGIPAAIGGMFAFARSLATKQVLEETTMQRDMAMGQLGEAAQMIQAQQMQLQAVQHEVTEHRKKFTETITPKAPLASHAGTHAEHAGEHAAHAHAKTHHEHAEHGEHHAKTHAEAHAPSAASHAEKHADAPAASHADKAVADKDKAADAALGV